MPTGVYQHKPHSEEAKLKMSRSQMGRPATGKGDRLSPEGRKRLSEATTRRLKGVPKPHMRGRKIPSVTGENHYKWQGYDTTYKAAHWWLNKEYGKALSCQNLACPKTATKYEWALLAGKEYKRDRNNYITLCTTCHRKYDRMNIELKLPTELKKFEDRESGFRSHAPIYKKLTITPIETQLFQAESDSAAKKNTTVKSRKVRKAKKEKNRKPKGKR